VLLVVVVVVIMAGNVACK